MTPTSLRRSPDKKTAGVALRRQFGRLHAIHTRRRRERPEHAKARYALVRWQSNRLRQTYSDLRAQTRYAKATEFFLREIYAPADFSQRDRDLEKITPVLVSVLPVQAIDAVALAMELNALTHRLDDELLAHLPSGAGISRPLTVEEYAEAYRASDKGSARLRQIDVIRSLGNDLDQLVRQKMLFAAVKTMRRPAELAGYADLHRFLETGFMAFRRMKGARHFLETIHARETQICHRLQAGHPTPFDLPGLKPMPSP